MKQLNFIELDLSYNEINELDMSTMKQGIKPLLKISGNKILQKIISEVMSDTKGWQKVSTVANCLMKTLTLSAESQWCPHPFFTTVLLNT